MSGGRAALGKDGGLGFTGAQQSATPEADAASPTRCPQLTLTPSQKVRFWSRVAVSYGCWTWTSTLTGQGYGQIRLGGFNWLAHRLSYSLRYGAIPEGLTLDHLCRNKACVNPAHLEPVTQAENNRRAVPFRYSPTHCPKGHPFESTAIRFPSDGNARRCGTCRREIQRASYRHRRSLVGAS